MQNKKHIQRLRWGIIVILAAILTSCGQPAQPDPTPTPSPTPTSVPSPTPQPSPTALPHGQIITITREEGAYHIYIPTTLPDSPDIAVLVHGTPGKDETALEVARYYIENWLDIAEEKGVVLIAPAFDNANYSSKDFEQAMGGYRGLFGRLIGADEFVLRLVDAYHTEFNSADDKFYLYGHSAGGQYTAHFIVTHPHRIKGAVITAAVIYPYPNPDVAWPYGLGELHEELEWYAPDVNIKTDIVPDEEKWLTATTLPVTVIVGMNDLEPQLSRPAQKGRNRMAIGRNWVNDMNEFAAQHGVEGKIKLSLIPKLGHSSLGLLPHSQAALLP